jgi:hypothetical protein
MMKTIGVLPASGKAQRILQLPKFLFPISQDETLIQWHFRMLTQVCDEVIVSTKPEWSSIVESQLPNAQILPMVPTTLSETLRVLIGNHSGDVLFGMPDTFVMNTEKNVYLNLASSEFDITLGLFDFQPRHKGKLGQVLIDKSLILDVRDKDLSCEYPHVWGNIKFRNFSSRIKLGKDTPSEEIMGWSSAERTVGSVLNEGYYLDVGTFEGILELYSNVNRNSKGETGN